jgi:hypothetical protein
MGPGRESEPEVPDMALDRRSVEILRHELDRIAAKEHLEVDDITRVGEVGRIVAGELAAKNRTGVLAQLGIPSEVAGTSRPTSLGGALVASSEYQQAAAAFANGDRYKFDTSIELKAAGDPVLESGGNNADAIAPTWLPQVYAPGLVAFPTRVQAVLRTQQIPSGGVVHWATATERSISTTAPTAEGTTKAGASFAFDEETADAQKFTALSGVSEELFQDAPALVTYINDQLLALALESEEVAIIAALYLAATGNVTGSGVSASPLGFDAVLEAMTQIRVAGGNPTAILINPNDWARMSATRAVAGDGDYFGGGPYQLNNRQLWGGLVEVQTPRVPEFTGLVGDFGSGATLFRKGGPRIDTSNSHDTYFAENKIAIRAEVRSVVGIHQPDWFVEVFLGS